MTTYLNLTELTNTTSLLGILKFIDGDNFMAGYFILFALIGFLIVLFTNYEYLGVKEAFTFLSLIMCSMVGLFYLAGLASIMLFVGALSIMVVSVLVFYLTD